MELINFVFGVIEQISPFTQEESAQLRNEIDQDIKKVIADPNAEGYKPTLKAKILHFCRNPWVRLAMVASFVLVVKGIKDWYNGKYDQVEKED